MITCSAKVAGTAIAGMKTQGIVVIVDTPKSGDVINPRVTAITRSAIPNTFQTTRAYFDHVTKAFGELVRTRMKGMFYDCNLSKL